MENTVKNILMVISGALIGACLMVIMLQLGQQQNKKINAREIAPVTQMQNATPEKTPQMSVFTDLKGHTVCTTLLANGYALVINYKTHTGFTIINHVTRVYKNSTIATENFNDLVATYLESHGTQQTIN